MTDPITCTCGHTQDDHWHSAGCLRCPCKAAPETVEIEALRRQVNELTAALDLARQQSGDLKLIELENYRMRAVLIKLTNHQKYRILNIKQVQDMAEAALEKLTDHRQVQDIARAALEEK